MRCFYCFCYILICAFSWWLLVIPISKLILTGLFSVRPEMVGILLRTEMVVYTMEHAGQV